MAKLRLLADVVALAAACVGFGAAYLQNQENKAIRQETVVVQELLVQSAQNGNFGIDVVNASIGRLGKVSGVPARQITPPPAQASQSTPPAAVPPPVVEELATSTEPVLKPGRLRLDEGTTLDLFKEGQMFTVSEINDRAVVLRDSKSLNHGITIGERFKVPGTECSIDVLATHPDETFKKKGWAELRTWCP